MDYYLEQLGAKKFNAFLLCVGFAFLYTPIKSSLNICLTESNDFAFYTEVDY